MNDRRAVVDELILRTYTEGDLPGCLAAFDSNVPDFFSTSERGDFEAFLSDLPGPYFVLIRDGVIVACGGYALAEGGSHVDLCWGMVHRDHHRTGIGRHLARLRIEQACRAPGVGSIRLSTSQHTVGFYENLGFETTQVVTNGFAPGLDRHDMVRVLRP